MGSFIPIDHFKDIWLNDKAIFRWMMSNQTTEMSTNRTEEHITMKGELSRACATRVTITVAWNSQDIQLKEVKQIFFFWQYTCSIWILQRRCMPEFLFVCLFVFLHSLLFCLSVNVRSSNEFSVQIWQLVHGTTLINGIYQPFRSFLLDEGSVILIAKECIDIKTRTPTLAFYDKEFHMKNIVLVPEGLCPPPT